MRAIVTSAVRNNAVTAAQPRALAFLRICPRSRRPRRALLLARATASEDPPPPPPSLEDQGISNGASGQQLEEVFAVEGQRDKLHPSAESATVDSVEEQNVETFLPTVSVPPPTAFDRAKVFARDNPIAGASIVAAGAFLGITFVIAVVRTAYKGIAPSGRRSRTVNKNKIVVEELAKYLPGRREGLSMGVIGGLRIRTGFSPVEIFRKYLWYLLRERKFDTEAVADVATLKAALGLKDEQVAEALAERARRVYAKYGGIMLDTSGMSAAGVERKATAQALFSKLLYLVECEDLLGGTAAEGVNVRDIFGATEDDVARLRIASLYEVDLDGLMSGASAAEQGTEQQRQEPSGEFDE
jgi:hypothetical protein